MFSFSRRECVVIRKLVRKQGINLHAALWRFRKIWCLLTNKKCSRNNSKVSINFFVVFFFCNPTCSLRYFVSFLVIWTITLSVPLLYLAIVIKVEWSPLLTMIWLICNMSVINLQNANVVVSLYSCSFVLLLVYFMLSSCGKWEDSLNEN